MTPPVEQPPSIALRMQSKADFFKMRRAGFSPQAIIKERVDQLQSQLKQTADHYSGQLLQNQEVVEKAFKQQSEEVSDKKIIEMREKQVKALEATVPELQKVNQVLKKNVLDRTQDMKDLSAQNSQLANQSEELKKSLKQKTPLPHEKQLLQLGSGISTYLSNSTNQS